MSRGIGGLIDFEINAAGYSEEKITASYSALLGGEENAKATYIGCVENPGLQPTYFLRTYSLVQLYEKTKAALGDKFDAKEFHGFVASLGPVSEASLEKWTDEFVKVKPGTDIPERPTPGDTDEPEDPDNPVVHTHDFAEPVYQWSADNKTCTARADCKSCDFFETETVTAVVSTTSATCTATGKTTYTAKFTKSVFTTQTKTVTTAKTAHKYGTPSYTLSSDNKTCTATRVCSVCKAKETEKGTVTSKVTTATCTATGKTVYTATFKNTAFKTQTKTETIAKKAHTYGKVSYTWAKDYSTCTATKTCSVCSAKLTQKVNTTSKTTAATYFAAGKTVYTAKFTKSGLAATTTKTVTIAKKTLGKVTGLKAKTSYKFRVRACRGKQYGAYSATLTASTTK